MMADRSTTRVVVTGMGAVSCFGFGVDAFWNGLVRGETGQAPIRGFDPSRYRSSYAAEVPWPGQNGDAICDGGADERLDRATEFSTRAATEALADACLGEAALRSAGCVLGVLSAHGSMNEHYARLYARQSSVEEAKFPDGDHCLLAHQVEHLVEHFRLEGPSTLVSTACSSSTDAIGYAVDLIRNGEAETMLAGGVDILAEFVHAGFNAMFSITTDKARPFDKSRSGFFIGEAAGLLILERLDRALERGAPIYAEVLGYGLSNTAFHLTATSDDGSGEALAIQRCLADAGIRPEQVDYLNAHGTATMHNDQTEAMAIRTVFGDGASRVAVSSIKPNIGHCMGASGVMEAIATIKCIQRGHIPAMLNSTGDVDAELDFVVGAGVEKPVRIAISESFGFGGASSAVMFSAFC